MRRRRDIRECLVRLCRPRPNEASGNCECGDGLRSSEGEEGDGGGETRVEQHGGQSCVAQSREVVWV